MSRGSRGLTYLRSDPEVVEKLRVDRRLVLAPLNERLHLLRDKHEPVVDVVAVGGRGRRSGERGGGLLRERGGHLRSDPEVVGKQRVDRRLVLARLPDRLHLLRDSREHVVEVVAVGGRGRRSGGRGGGLLRERGGHLEICGVKNKKVYKKINYPQI